jgi:uncharacterized protein
MIDGLRHYLKYPKWKSQHGWRKAIWATMSSLGLTGLHGLPLNRRWVEIHRRPMPLIGLDPLLNGLKIVQISDLHYSPVVSERYLLQYIRWVNDLEPHIVVVTGDLITGGYRFAHRIATILTHIHAPSGVICTFGNHDYSIYGKSNAAESDRRGDYLEKCLGDRGLIVLRNQSLYFRDAAGTPKFAMVGLDDEWSEHIDPALAFSGVDPKLPIICLNHNPANVKELLDFPWQWMLSGHTHGRAVATSKFGRALYAHRYRHYVRGHYEVEGRHLYVNRGLSYGQRMMDWCRPEITVFRLKSA